MTSPADGLCAIIEAAGLIGGSTQWKARVGVLTDDPQTIAFISMAGRQPEVSVAIDYPAVQVLGRGSSAAGGRGALYDKMREIYDALHGIPSNPAAYPALTSCIARGDIQEMGRDANDRYLASMNFNLIVTPAGVGHRVTA